MTIKYLLVWLSLVMFSVFPLKIIWRTTPRLSRDSLKGEYINWNRWEKCPWLKRCKWLYALLENVFWQAGLKIITQWPTTIDSSISIEISIIGDKNHNLTPNESQEAANDYSRLFTSDRSWFIEILLEVLTFLKRSVVKFSWMNEATHSSLLGFPHFLFL